MKIETVPLSSIHPDPANVRTHNPRNLEAIAGSLKRFGQQKPIVVDAEGIIRAGNGTYAAATHLGWTEIQIVRTTLNGPEAIAYAIADNRTGELAGWDVDALNAQWGAMDENLRAAMGFTDAEMQQLLDDVTNPAAEVVEDQVPLPPDAATTKPGDLIILGNHRLLCGDSASPTDLDRLLGGQVIHLVNTDPPYNVAAQPRTAAAFAAGNSTALPTNGHNAPAPARLRAKDRTIANDDMGEAEYHAMLDAWFGNIARVLEPGRGFYIWGGYSNLANYPAALKKHGLYFSQAIIWVKKHPVLTRKDFMGDHEWAYYGALDFKTGQKPAAYGWKEGRAHRFFGPANVPDVWEVKKVSSQAMVHLTEKPVELAARAMQYSSHPGENVLDLFGGSGSTLMAAEQTGRHAFLMELDPLYCDVIVTRWQNFTGKQAVRQPSPESAPAAAAESAPA